MKQIQLLLRVMIDGLPSLEYSDILIRTLTACVFIWMDSLYRNLASIPISSGFYDDFNVQLR